MTIKILKGCVKITATQFLKSIITSDVHRNYIKERSRVALNLKNVSFNNPNTHNLCVCVCVYECMYTHIYVTCHIIRPHKDIFSHLKLLPYKVKLCY